MRKTRKWSAEDDKYIKENIGLGLAALQNHFSVSGCSIRSRATSLGASIAQYKRDNPKEKFHKADNSEKFKPDKHVIKNASVDGKTPVFIPSKNMTIFVSAGKDIAATVERYTREKSYV